MKNKISIDSSGKASFVGEKTYAEGGTAEEVVLVDVDISISRLMKLQMRWFLAALIWLAILAIPFLIVTLMMYMIPRSASY